MLESVSIDIGLVEVLPVATTLLYALRDLPNDWGKTEGIERGGRAFPNKSREITNAELIQMLTN